MLETAILVLLYNKEISEANTLRSLLTLPIQFSNSRLVIWNNGPNKLVNTDCDAFKQLGYEVSIKETLNNESLAVIYNQFIAENESEKYIFLDDDSALTNHYVSESSKLSGTQLGMPIITSEGKIQSPSIDHKRYSKPINLTAKNKVRTIGSGLVIGGSVINKLNELYGSAFDERFYLYDVDTTFCLRLYQSKLTPQIQIISGFEHSLSRLTIESSELSEFRRKERSCALGLRFRYYVPITKAVLLVLKTFLGGLRKGLVGKQYKVSLPHFIKAYILGKHYRIGN